MVAVVDQYNLGPGPNGLTLYREGVMAPAYTVVPPSTLATSASAYAAPSLQQMREDAGRSCCWQVLRYNENMSMLGMTTLIILVVGIVFKSNIMMGIGGAGLGVAVCILTYMECDRRSHVSSLLGHASYRSV